MVSIALAWAASLAGATVTHPSIPQHAIPRHHAHAAESRSPHAAETRHPHAAGKHAKAQKPPKRSVAAHEKPPKVAKH
jgi:hypothetical protein